MTTTLPAMRDALVSALYARLAAKLDLVELTGAVDAALATVGYAGLVDGLASADAAAAAYKSATAGAPPANLAELDAAWTDAKTAVEQHPINRDLYIEPA